MNMLARILSHGFAIALVLLLAIGFMYRGELFPNMPIPAFLGIEKDVAKEAETATEPVTVTADAEDKSTTAADTAADTTSEPAPAVDTGTEPLPAGVPAPAADEVTGADMMPAPAPVAEPESPDTGPGAVIPAPPVKERDLTAGTVGAGTPPAAADIPRVVEARETASDEPAAETTAPVPGTIAPVPPPVTELVDTSRAETPVDTPAAESTPEGVQEAPVIEPVAPETAPRGETAEEPAAATEPVPAPGDAGDPVEAEPAAGTVLPDTGAGAVSPVPAAVITEETAVADDVAAAETTATGIETQPPATDTAPATDAPAETILDMSRPYHVLAAAREAYWLRNLEEAESLYRQLIALEPDNPDGYGELGNLYFTQGRWEDAASAYFEAGSRLARSGHDMEAENLLEVIRGLNSPQADELAGIIAESR